MRFLSALFGRDKSERDRKLPFVTGWVLSDLDAYSPKYPVRDPLVISSALEFVTAFFLVLGAEFPERVRGLLVEMNYDERQIDDFLDRSQLPDGAALPESLGEIAEHIFRHNTRLVCSKHLAQRGVPIAEGQDPAAIALGIGLEKPVVMAIFQMAALHAMKYSYQVPADVSKLVDEFLTSAAAGLASFHDRFPELGMQSTATTGPRDATELRNMVERTLVWYDAS